MAKFGLHITGFVLLQHDNCYVVTVTAWFAVAWALV